MIFALNYLDKVNIDLAEQSRTPILYTYVKHILHAPYNSFGHPTYPSPDNIALKFTKYDYENFPSF